MVKNRIYLLLCFSIFFVCIVFSQTNDRWIRLFEDNKGNICFYQSDIKTDRDNNHYVWLKCVLSPEARKDATNEFNSSVPVHSLLLQVKYDSEYELAKMMQLVVLGQSGKVLVELKGEVFPWMDEKEFIPDLSIILREQSNKNYRYREQPRNGYRKNKIQSDEVYNKLLAKIREKQIELSENASKQSVAQEDQREEVQEEMMPQYEAREDDTQRRNRVYDVVEEMPQFPGGPSALFEYLSKSIIYPADAEKNGTQGRVIVTFVVERDGSITNVNVVKNVDTLLDKEAYRVVRSMPHWIPGRQNGTPVRVNYTVPVTFKLQ